MSSEFEDCFFQKERISEEAFVENFKRIYRYFSYEYCPEKIEIIFIPNFILCRDEPDGDFEYRPSTIYLFSKNYMMSSSLDWQNPEKREQLYFLTSLSNRILSLNVKTETSHGKSFSIEFVLENDNEKCYEIGTSSLDKILNYKQNVWILEHILKTFLAPNLKGNKKEE